MARIRLSGNEISKRSVGYEIDKLAMLRLLVGPTGARPTFVGQFIALFLSA